MQLLGLTDTSSGSMPASRFPERASAYFCDKCGEDITGRFHVRRGHGGMPLGPPIFYCACGERYLSGAREWDQLRSHEKRSELVGLAASALLGTPFAASVVAAALGIHSHNSWLFFAAIALAILTSPLSVALWLCFLGVRDLAASLCRTGVLSRRER